MSSGGQEFRKEQNLVIIFIAAAVFVFLPLIMTAVILVAIIWTHRPDLSVADILREAVKERRNRKPGRTGRKEKEYEQDYHL